MNKYKFMLKFIINKEGRSKYKWNLLFPFIGTIIGCITVALTLSIMEGMEYAIFTKLEIFHSQEDSPGIHLDDIVENLNV